MAGIERIKVSPGVVLVDKPKGCTSFAVVRRIRRLTGIRKIGHAGTLDPFATGLLVVCIGRPATRHINYFMAGQKKYEAILQLGVETETLDPEGKVMATAPVPLLDAERLARGLRRFTGVLMQTPPPFSAVKHEGKPLYYYARKGIVIKKEPRPVTIYTLDLLSYDTEKEQIGIRVCCSRGTYIRVLAEDIGRWIGCGAHLVDLRRTGSGHFSVADSMAGDHLFDEEKQGRQLVQQYMLPVEEALAAVAMSGGKEKNRCQSC